MKNKNLRRQGNNRIDTQTHANLSTLSNGNPKEKNTEPRWWLKRFWRLSYAPTYEEEIIIKGFKLILQGQGGPKRKWVNYKRSLAEAIVPSNGTQPFARLRKYRALLCKVVITSTHALPWHPRGFLWWKLSQLSTLSGNLKCTVSGVDASENPIKLKENTLTTQISWNLALGYIGFQ